MKICFRCCLILFLALAFTACPASNPKKNAKKPATTDTPIAAVDENDSVDFQAFLGRLRKAVEAHDANAVASMMTVDFGYRLEPVGSGPGVFQYWDESNLWVELQGVLAEKFVPKGAYMVAPAQFADPASSYEGYRAGIRRVKGSWKFAHFVTG
ncbi:MAG: hypothetical protein ACR2MW_06615 [Chthoniobacterales bacterium]